MKLSLLLLLFLPLAGCAPKMGGGSGSPSLVKIFSRADGSTLYFAGPLYYEEADGKNKMELDFTLIKMGKEKGMVTCNYTLVSRELNAFAPKTFALHSDSGKLYEAVEFKKLFQEKKRKDFRYRYSFELPEEEWVLWMKANPHFILLNDSRLEGGKKHKKHRQMIADQVLFSIQQ